MKFLTASLILLLSVSIFAQNQGVKRPHCENENFHKEVDKYTSDAVDLIDVTTVFENKGDYILLDAREQEEYEISHIPGAIYIGYDHFDMDLVAHLLKDKPVVVYCSIGYRSEKIGVKLKKSGFEEVQNLYGSIFEWVNRGYSLESKDGQKVKTLHTYNKKWSQWIFNDEIVKTW